MSEHTEAPVIRVSSKDNRYVVSAGRNLTTGAWL